MLYFMVIIWAVLEVFWDSEVFPRRIPPGVIFYEIRQVGEPFVLIVTAAGVFYAARHCFPQAENFLPAAGILIFYFTGYVSKRREIFFLMALVFAALLSGGTLSSIIVKGFFVASGVCGVRFILRGIQRRQLFSPVPKLFSGTPGLLVTAALAALILSAVFVR